MGSGRSSTGIASTTSLVSFDGRERVHARLASPDRLSELERLINEASPLSVRGSGLSYANASAAQDGLSISTKNFDRILDFDADAATVRVEPGLTMGALLRFVVDRELYFPVLPGHPHISVGGCVAFNTHGKTQHDVGQFSDHVAGLTLLHPDHGEIRCEPDDDMAFDLTLGGMGLTGLISEVTLRLQPLAGRSIRRRIRQVTDFGEAVETMEAHDAPGSQLYSWNDATRRSSSFGRGFVFEETFVDDEASPRSSYNSLRSEARGRFVPVPLWNRLSTGLINRVWAAWNRRRDDLNLPVIDAAFPVNGREGYFHLFGRRGFHEYQLIVPRDAWSEAVDRVHRLIERTGACVTLSSLKLFRGTRHLLWFRGDGVCLTLDGPATDSTRRLFQGLDDLAITLGAPVNLAKDSRIEASAVSQIFPGYQEFRERLADFDPQRRFDSALRRRIDV